VSWFIPSHAVVLPDDEVHVWRADLSLDSAAIARLVATLSPDERARAARFHFERDRRRFTAARGVLRQILAGYLGQDPALIEFNYSPSGKPSLDSDVRFNMSHSHELALYAIARRKEVGVDVERIRPQVAEEQIAERFFSPREAATLRALPANVQAEAFFNCWTRKEAYIKARGEGLGIPLDSFDVSLAPGEPAAILAVRNEPQEMLRWSIESLAPAPGYVSAVVAEGHHWRLRLWRWEPGVT
jgi:4'-phosphopantetheinyl transferase